MIIRNNKPAVALYKGTKEIIKRYKGTVVVYESFRNILISGTTPLVLTKCKGVVQTLEKKQLPEEYQAVEYIESTGTQYIDTGVKLTSNYTVELDYQLTERLQYRAGLFGNLANSGDTKNIRYGSILSPSNACLEHGYGLGNAFYQVGEPDTDRHYLKQDGNKIYFDNVLVYTFKEASFTIDDTALLCNFDFTNYMPAKAKYYSSKWFDGETLVRDFVPCYRKSDGVIGFYDLIGDTFYTNIGTGEFLKGKNIVNRLPDTYQEVRYIEGTGTQWINTGVYPDDNTVKLEVKVSYNDIRTGQLMGAGTSGNERFNFGIEGGRFRFGFGSGWFDANSTKVNEDTEPHVWILDANTKTGSIDGVEQTTENSYIPTGSRAILLFARGSGSIAESGNRTKGKIYYVKIWDKGELVRDMIPCYKKETNEIGMYDLIEGLFYKNGGTGEFLKGSDVIDKLPEEYQELEYIESTGTQYIDTGVIPTPNVGAKLVYHITGRVTSDSCMMMTGSDSWRWGFGYRNSGDVLQISGLCYSGVSWENYYVSIKKSTIEYNVNNDHTCYLNGNLLRDNIPVGTVTTTGTIYIFASNYNGEGTTWRPGVMRVYRCQMYTNGHIIRDFIPCVRKSDNAVGLYDMIENEFHANGGTDEFIKGSKIIPQGCLIDYKMFGDSIPEEKTIPDEYQEVEYITSKQSGDIITDVIATNNIGIDMVLRLSDIAGSQYILGSRESKIEYAMNGSGSRTDWDIRFNGNVIYSDVTRTGDKWRTRISMINGNGTWYLSNLDTGEEWNFDIKNVANMNSTIPLTLFSYNTPNGTGAYYYHNGITVYSLKMYDGETLIRDFKPCYRKSDNLIGMYDIVGDKFYEPRIKTVKQPFTRGNRTGVVLESVGERTSNIYDKKTYPLTNGYINYSGGGSFTSSNYKMTNDYIPIKPNTTYSINYTAGGSNPGIAWYDENKTYVGGVKNGVNFTTSNNAAYLRFSVNSDVNEDDIQFNEGPTVLDHEPYGYKIPVKVGGKNLVNIPDIDGNSGNGTVIKCNLTKPIFVSCQEYPTSIVNSSGEETSIWRLEIRALDGTIHRIWDAHFKNPAQAHNLKINASEENPITSITYRGTYIKEGRYAEIQVEYGDVKTDYTPYVEPIITNIYLDEPLRKLGDYADTIDFERDRVIRKIGSYTYTGLEEGWFKNATTNEGYGAYRCEGAFTPLIGAPADTAYMTHFDYVTKGATADFLPGEFRFAYGGSQAIGSSRVYMATLETTLDDFIAWVSKTKPTIYYPIEDKIEAISLPNIPTFRGTTILEVNTDMQPSKMDVIYKGKK